MNELDRPFGANDYRVVINSAVPNVLVLKTSDAQSLALALLMLPRCAHILNLRALFGGMISRTDLARPRGV